MKKYNIELTYDNVKFYLAYSNEFKYYYMLEQSNCNKNYPNFKEILLFQKYKIALRFLQKFKTKDLVKNNFDKFPMIKLLDKNISYKINYFRI